MSSMLDDLFSFPIIMVDGDNEEKKQEQNSKLGLDQELGEVDIIEGEAECPFHDFVSVSDRWKPTDKSFDLALGGKFDACYVIFAQSGTYLVPWTKKKFKTELKKFIDSRPKDEEEIRTAGFHVINIKDLIEKDAK